MEIFFFSEANFWARFAEERRPASILCLDDVECVVPKGPDVFYTLSAEGVEMYAKQGRRSKRRRK